MAGIAGEQIGLGTGSQPPIGEYVEAGSENLISAATNYIGMNSKTAYKTNVLAEGSVVPETAPQPDWIVPDNDNDVAGGTSQWVMAGADIAENGDCLVSAGVATPGLGAGTYTCYVTGGVKTGDYFWAVLTAEA